jgi:hypothetical protein
MKDESGYFRLLETDKDQQFNMAFYCPGCKCHHGINTNHEHRPAWNVTFTAGKPTVTPSILVTSSTRCHLFIKHGEIEYLTDCTHELAGKTIPMELEED